MMATWGAMRREWCDWWRGAGRMGRWLLLTVVGGYFLMHAALDGWRLDPVLMGLSLLGCYYAGPRLRPLFWFLLPLALMGMVYDAQRYWAEELRAEVRVAEPHEWEVSWFGIEEGGERITPAAWWQTRTHALLDLVCGAVYLVFLPAYLVTAAWWRFKERRREADWTMWALLGLNLAGYATYLIYPAAPPWYVDIYGMGPAVLTAVPEAAGAARFDALLGVQWFAGFYGRNANVFGAIPSLHVAQTFLTVLFAWQFRSLRLTATGYWLLMTFASVYLNHHYLVDGVVGMVFALVAWLAVWRPVRRYRKGGPPERRPS